MTDESCRVAVASRRGRKGSRKMTGFTNLNLRIKEIPCIRFTNSRWSSCSTFNRNTLAYSKVNRVTLFHIHYRRGWTTPRSSLAASRRRCGNRRRPAAMTEINTALREARTAWKYQTPSTVPYANMLHT